MSETEVKQQVRQFYDRVGWQKAGGGVYQNARYEDLRPVAAEYIHRCHLRVTPFLQSGGRFLLDVGSGPVQYEEYLTYSENYQRRLCVDISHVALVEARSRLGEHGLYVVSDAANLPFSDQSFDGLVSLHTLHHLPLEEQKKAYREFYRVLSPGKNAVVVNGWTDSVLMRFCQPVVNLMERIGRWAVNKRCGENKPEEKPSIAPRKEDPTGTFIRKMEPEWMRKALSPEMDYEIRVWRSVNVRFLRAVIHRQLAGKLILKIIFRLEEWFPHFFGKNGQYPLIVIRKP